MPHDRDRRVKPGDDGRWGKETSRRTVVHHSTSAPRFAAQDARFSAMEVRWGLVPDMGGMALLPELVRADVARDLVWSGRIVAAQEALALGLITRVCADPRAEALAYARQVATRSPDAVRAGKRLLGHAVRMSVAEILREESVEQLALIGSPNQLEAVAANLEKREPQFNGGPSA